MTDSPPWPFDDPEDLGVFTVSPVLSGAKPILEVSHDVSDGTWQFLTGEHLDLSQAKLVCLTEVVALDPSLRELADLPLGSSATRTGRGKPWTRTTTYPTDWSELLQAAYAYTETQQARLRNEFSLLSWQRYDYHQEGGILVLSSGTPERLVTQMQIVGSHSTNSGTWLWAWDNPHILGEASRYVHLLQKFGEQQQHVKLSTPQWEADEVDGWEMTAVACLLLGGEGVYRAPHDTGAVYMVLSKPELVQTA